MLPVLLIVMKLLLSLLMLAIAVLLVRYGGRAVGWLLARFYDFFISDKNHVAPT